MSTPTRRKRIQHVVESRITGAVVLEDIHDPHNAAAILRSCDAFGIQNIYFIFDKTTPYNPRRVGKSSSSSANKWLTYHIFHTTQECFEALHADGYHVASTILNPTAQSLYEYTVPQAPVALVVGNEHTGISEAAAAHSDSLLYVPMMGFVESLNVSVCTAICLFELSRQKRNAPYETALPTDTQQSLIEEFLAK